MLCVRESNILTLTTTQGLRLKIGDFRWFAVVCSIYTYIFGSFIIDLSLFAFVCSCLHFLLLFAVFIPAH